MNNSQILTTPNINTFIIVLSDVGKKKKGKPGSLSKDMFGKRGKKEGAPSDEPAMITHTLPRLVNLQHSQI